MWQLVLTTQRISLYCKGNSDFFSSMACAAMIGSVRYRRFLNRYFAWDNLVMGEQ